MSTRAPGSGRPDGVSYHPGHPAHPAHSEHYEHNHHARQPGHGPEFWERDRVEPSIAARRMGRERGVTRISGTDVDTAPPFTATYKVAGVAPIAAGADSPPYPVYWPVSGIVREMAGCIVNFSGGQPMASIGVTITIMDGREDILKSAGAAGNAGPDFHLFSTLFGYAGLRRVYLQRPVYATLSWQVRFHNYGIGTFTPDLTFFLDEDPHGVRREWFKRVEVPVGTEVVVYGGGDKKRIVIAE